MIDTLEFMNELKEAFEPSQAEKLARLMGRLYKELANTVTKVEFEELRKTVSQLADNVKELSEAQKRTEQVVAELAEAQRKSEERLTRLEQAVAELVEAQKRTEQRVEELAQAQRRTEQRVEELAEAQRETQKEVSRLDRALQELAEAQKRTEQRVEELAEAQRETQKEVSRLDRALQELAQAQKRTEEEIRKLAKGLDETREQLGGLSDTVGYTLENEAYKALPRLLHRDYGLTVKGRLKRGYLTDKAGRAIEVNILGEATRNGKKITIIGEGKARLSKKAINEFIQKRLKRFEPLFKKIFPVLVTHMISEPDAEKYAKEKGIALYYSYDF